VVDDLDYAGMDAAEPALQRYTLLLAGLPHPGLKRQLAYPICYDWSEILLDNAGEHVEDGVPTGATAESLIDLEERLMRIQFRKPLGKDRELLPVDGPAEVLKETRTRRYE
jgi:hypothetical protein